MQGLLDYFAANGISYTWKFNVSTLTEKELNDLVSYCQSNSIKHDLKEGVLEIG